MAARALATAFVNIVPGTKDVEAYLKGGGLKQQAASAGGASGGSFANGFGASLKKLIGPAALAAAGYAMTSFVKGAVQGASSLQSELGGVGQTFGQYADKVKTFAQNAATSAGLTEVAALQAAKGFGGFAQSAGLAGESSANFAIQLTQLAGDLGSFYDTSSEEAIGAIKSALQGSAEPMLKYNVLLNDMTLRQQAVKMGLIETTDQALTPQMKILAAHAEIMKQTGRVQGDFVTYASDFANAQKSMSANFQNMQATLGSSLLPVLGQLMSAMNPIITRLGPLLFDVFLKLVPLFELVTKTVMDIMPALDPLINAFGMLVEVVVEILQIALPPLLEIFNAFMPVLAPLISLFMVIIQQILPPLAKLISEVLVPILSFLVGLLTTYVIPYFSRLAEVLGGVLTWAIDGIVKGFQWLVKKLEPVWAFIKPFIDGLASLMGLKPIKVKVSATGASTIGDYNMGKKGKTGDYSKIDYGKIGASAVTGGTKKTKAEIDKSIKALLTATSKKIAAAKTKLDNAVAKAQANHAEAIAKADAKYNETVTNLTATRDKDLLNLEKEHAGNIAQIQKDFAQKMADIVRESKDRLRSAFESVAAVDVGKTFADLANKNADSLIGSLKAKLTAAKKLVESAGALASAGFSQTFIEQVVAQGPDAGNAMAEALLAAGPESQKELQNLFTDSEQLANHGMDALANSMYEKSGLANEALRSMYAQAQTDLVTALETEQSVYLESQKTIQTAFADGMEEARKVRAEEYATADKELNEAMAKAIKDFNTEMEAIDKEFKEKLKEFTGQLGGYAGKIRDIKGDIAAAIKEANTPIVITTTQVVNTVYTSSGSSGSTKGFVGNRIAMATGGLVTKPTNALIGEAGPEVVTPLKQLEQWLGIGNNDASAAKTVNYYAAPNTPSISAEDALFTALERARAIF